MRDACSPGLGGTSGGDYQQAGAIVIKGAARLTGPGKVEAGGELMQADHIVIATGSQPQRPRSRAWTG